MRETQGGVIRVANCDFLEILDASEIAVEVVRTVGQPHSLDRIEIVDQEKKTSRSDV